MTPPPRSVVDAFGGAWPPDDPYLPVVELAMELCYQAARPIDVGA